MPHSSRIKPISYLKANAAEIVSTLREEGAEYIFETRGKSRGLATFFVPRQALEISRFRVSEDGLVALSYLRDAGKADPRDDTRAEFDWANGTVATTRPRCW